MPRGFVIGVALLLLALPPFALAEPEVEAVLLEVSKEGPLSTLEQARDAARAFAGKRPVRILIRGGTYALSQPLVLDGRDAGTAEAPVTWAAWPGETPVLSGGRVLEAARIEEDGTWIAEIADEAPEARRIRHLFVGGRRRFRPTLGPFVVAGLTDAPARTGMRHRQSQDEFRYHPGDIEAWPDLADVEVVVFHDWSASRLRVRELDEEAGIVRFTGFPVHRVGHWWKDAKNPYYLENVAGAWGRPGEWHVSPETGVLRYRPATDEDPHALEVVAPRLTQLVRLSRSSPEEPCVSHVRFEGLTFQHTGWALPPEGYGSGQGMIDLPAAFEASGAQHCRIEGCVFEHLGAYAIELKDGVSDNEVIGCRMWDLGGGGVKVGGGAGVPMRNVVADNVISDGGLDHFSAIGVWVGIADGTEIRHNLIRRYPYTGISVGWKWNTEPTACQANVVTGNHIHEVMRLLADGGGIYTLGLQPDTTLAGNHIHDVRRSRLAGRAPNNGIFLDQGSKAYRIEGNAIHRTAGTPIRFHQSKREWHTFSANELGDPSSGVVASKAGPRPPYAQLARGLPAVAYPPLLASAIADDPNKTRTLRVMTWNLHHGEGVDGTYDLTRIARVIQSQGADVVLCQEVDRGFSKRSSLEDQPAILADLLGFHAYYGPTIDDRYGNLVLSRHPFAATKNLALPNPDAREPRGVIVAATRVGDADLVVLNTHLCAWSATNRTAQVKSLRVLLRSIDEPFLLGGDFNTTSEGELHALLEAARAIDTREALLGLGAGIDDILVAPALRAQVVAGRVLPGPWSDHPAYWIDVTIPRP